MTILFELKTVFPDIPVSQQRIDVHGRIRNIDVLIPKLRTIIEYDGKYWHRGKEDQDLLFVREAEREGFTVLRVREFPLSPIGVAEITFKPGTRAKALVDRVLTWLLENQRGLTPTQRRRLREYLACPRLKNEQALSDYIANRIQKRFAGEKGSKPVTRSEFARMMLTDDRTITLKEMEVAWKRAMPSGRPIGHAYYQTKYDMGLTKKRRTRGARHKRGIPPP